MGSCKRVVLSAREIFRDREIDARTRDLWLNYSSS